MERHKKVSKKYKGGKNTIDSLFAASLNQPNILNEQTPIQNDDYYQNNSSHLGKKKKNAYVSGNGVKYDQYYEYDPYLADNQSKNNDYITYQNYDHDNYSKNIKGKNHNVHNVYDEYYNASSANQNYSQENQSANIQSESYPTQYKTNKTRKKNHTNKHKNISKILNQKENLKFHLEKRNLELPELTSNLINGLIEGSIECMICNDIVDFSKEVWGCEKCYTIFHNTCIYDWIFKLNTQQEGKSAILLYKWTCPHCSHNYSASAENLPVYNCYCGKFYDAQKSKIKNFNPELIPHGCGLVCDKDLCQHVKCQLPCHPGPHQPCSVVDKISCFCSKIEKEVPCLVKEKNFSCNQICDKLLICKRHKCKFTCHESECESLLKNKKCQECLKESKNKFYVFLKGLEDKIKKELNLNITSFADGLSEYIFHGTLLCGLHHVEPNTDNNLQFLLKLLQVSGGKLVENIRKFVPVCKNIVDNSCDCRNKVSKTECFKLKYKNDILQFLGLEKNKVTPQEKCTKSCKSFKNCKNHRCNRVCCELSGTLIRNYSIDDPEGHHLCLLSCGRLLNCKTHYCENFCHKGPCKPCPNIIRDGSISCDCGRTKIDAPFVCGTEVNCKLPCDKATPCEHPCKLLCHKGECQECDEITFKICRCKKTVVQNVRCGDKNTPLCKTPCGEMLPCGVHFCAVPCHEHTQEYDSNYFCMMQCGRDLQECKHKCMKRCHGEDDCPEIDCEVQIKIVCKCKTFSRNIKCGEFKKLYNNDPNYCLPCIEECAKKDRLKRIEQAFDDLLKFSEEKNKVFSRKFDNSNHEESTQFGSGLKFIDTKFDNNLLLFAKKNVKFIIELEALIEKSLKNQSIKRELPKFEKKLYGPISEYLKNYYNIKVDKIKKAGDSWSTLILGDCSEAVLPKYRLSLMALIFKYNKFATNQKLNIFHPFEMSILVQNYRYSVVVEDIENYLLSLCNLNKNEFYIDEIEKGKCYVHFFNLEVGKKLYYQLKLKPSQYQDSYEIYYNLKDDLKLDELYSYMKNQEYFNLLYYKDDDSLKHSEKESDKENNEVILLDEPDADGFVLVSKGKKPK